MICLLSYHGQSNSMSEEVKELETIFDKKADIKAQGDSRSPAQMSRRGVDNLNGVRGKLEAFDAVLKDSWGDSARSGISNAQIQLSPGEESRGNHKCRRGRERIDG